MKNKFYLFFLLALLYGRASFAQDKPLFNEVATRYFSQYTFDRVGPSYLVFMKKKDGWYTANRSADHLGSYENIQLFWSAANRSWLSLNFPPAKDTSQTAITEAIAGYLGFYSDDFPAYNYEYDHCVYYGYADWDRDVIKEYGDNTALDAPGLESLARAYANYAGSFFYDVYGRHDKTNPKDRYGESPKDNFIGFETKAIDTYSRLRRQAPAYQTLWGNIAIKCGNEHLYAYSVLASNGFGDEAKKFLTPGIYPDSFLQESRRYFDGLEPNGILITARDNDTYPLWYLQEVQHERADLTIVNYAMLESTAYLAYLDGRYHGLFRTGASYYKKRDFAISLFSDFFPCKGPSPLGPFLDSMNTSDRTMKEVSKDGVMSYDDSTRRYHCMDVYVDLAAKNTGDHENTGNQGKAGILRLKLNEALTSNDFMLLDIFATNIGKRAVYFTDANGWLFGPRLRQKGKVYYAVAD